MTLTFHPAGADQDIVWILSCKEGRFDAAGDGAWQRRRWLSGDQTHQGRHVRLEAGRFAVQRVQVYRYR